MPGRTAAVFLAARPLAEQIDLLIGDVDALVAGGALDAGRANKARPPAARAVWRRKARRGKK